MALTKHEIIVNLLGKIEQHLKTLNDKVAKNVKDIAKLQKSQTQDDLDKAKIQGGWKVLAVLGSVAMAVGGLILKYYK